MEFIHQPTKHNRLGDYLIDRLNGDWTEFRAAIAFAKRSGTKHLVPHLNHFAKNGNIELLVGIDHLGTSKEALSDLIGALKKTDQLNIVHNEISSTFHPKVYIFTSKTMAEIVIGSGNLTEGGLFTNFEASVLLKLDLGVESDRTFLKSIIDTLDAWKDKKSGISLRLDEALLNKLVANGYVPIEALVKKSALGSAKKSPSGTSQSTKKLFASIGIPHAPKVVKKSTSQTKKTNAAKPKATAISKTVTPKPKLSNSVSGFVMTLQQTDVGKGQTTKGASRRSPEIFIPLRAVRDVNPGFWGWPSKFVDSSTKLDRKNVKMKIGTQIIDVNIMSWKVKKDFRLRHEALRSAGSIGDILRIEEVNPKLGYEYYVEVIPQGTTLFATYDALCTIAVGGNSKKSYGYY